MKAILALWAMASLIGGVHAEPGKSFRDCPDCPEMVVVPAGTFRMGTPFSAADQSESAPEHMVMIRTEFAAGKYEVMRREYAIFATATGRKKDPDCPWNAPGFRQTDDHPVVCVSWNDAEEYATWLRNKTGKPYRLLTEAEWEYAARSGTTTRWYWGNDAGKACRYENILDRASAAKENSPLDEAFPCQDGFQDTSPVGRFRPNAFGLHDMIGNVDEWVQDCWHGDYRGAPRDGSAWVAEQCDRRVVRGGACQFGLAISQSAYRSSPLTGLASRGIYMGFRVALTLAH